MARQEVAPASVLDPLPFPTSPVCHPSLGSSARVFGSVTNDGRLVWVVRGALLEVFSAQNGERCSSWCFGTSMKDVVAKVTAVQELTNSCQFLVVAVDRQDKSLVCLFDIGNSKVIKAIEVPSQVTSLTLLSCSEKDDTLLSIMAPGLQDMSGQAAVSTADGKVLVIDLCLDQENYSSEQAPGQLVFRTLESSSFPNRLEIRNSRHHPCFLICDLETFDDDDFDIENDDITVTCLSFLPQLVSLAVGLSTGVVQVWSLQSASLFFNVSNPEINTPVVEVVLQEPENDPHTCCYLWVIRGRKERPKHRSGCITTCSMHALMFRRKNPMDYYGYLYQDLLSSRKCFEYPLSPEVVSVPPREGWYENTSRLISCKVVQQADVLGMNRVDLSDSLPMDDWTHDLNVCILTWELWSGNDLMGTYISVLDINQWYLSQMPSYYRASVARLCPYMGVFSLSDVIDKSGEQPALDIHVVSTSLSKFQSQSTVEQLYFPASLAFKCIHVTVSGVIHATFYGLQRQILLELQKQGLSSIAQPRELFLLCHTAGLISNMSDHSAISVPLPTQRESLLTLALENSQMDFLVSCLEQWSCKGNINPDLNLKFLMDWAWKKVNQMKYSLDKICLPLFNCSINSVEKSLVRKLRNYASQLGNLSTLFKLASSHSSTQFVTDFAQELEVRYKVTQLIALYMQVMLWMLDCHLLPEHHEFETHGENEVAYPYSSFKKYYMQKRERYRTNRSDLKKDDVLLIDCLVSHIGQNLTKVWENLGGTENYPPNSLYSSLAVYLLQDVPLAFKHSLMLYFLLDMAAHMNLKQFHFVGKLYSFPASFSVSSSIVKLIQGCWLLDHDEVEDAMSNLTDPVISSSGIFSWQHSNILNVLLLREEHQKALKYLLHIKPAPETPEGVKLYINVFLANGLVSDALQYVRKCSDQASAEPLLHHIFSVCQKKKNGLEQLLQQALTLKEEVVLIQLLQNENVEKLGLLVAYFLQRGRFSEASHLAQKIRESQFGSRERTNPVLALLQGFKCVLPESQMQGNSSLLKGLSDPKESEGYRHLSIQKTQSGMFRSSYQSRVNQSCFNMILPAKPETPAPLRSRREAVFATPVSQQSPSSSKISSEHGSYPKRLKFIDKTPIPRGDIERRRSFRNSAAEALSLLQTPPMKRKSPSSTTPHSELDVPTISILSNRKAPQSILKQTTVSRPSPPPTPPVLTNELLTPGTPNKHLRFDITESSLSSSSDFMDSASISEQQESRVERSESEDLTHSREENTNAELAAKETCSLSPQKTPEDKSSTLSDSSPQKLSFGVPTNEDSATSVHFDSTFSFQVQTPVLSSLEASREYEKTQLKKFTFLSSQSVESAGAFRKGNQTDSAVKEVHPTVPEAGLGTVIKEELVQMENESSVELQTLGDQDNFVTEDLQMDICEEDDCYNIPCTQDTGMPSQTISDIVSDVYKSIQFEEEMMEEGETQAKKESHQNKSEKDSQEQKSCTQSSPTLNIRELPSLGALQVDTSMPDLAEPLMTDVPATSVHNIQFETPSIEGFSVLTPKESPISCISPSFTKQVISDFPEFSESIPKEKAVHEVSARKINEPLEVSLPTSLSAPKTPVRRSPRNKQEVTVSPEGKRTEKEVPLSSPQRLFIKTPPHKEADFHMSVSKSPGSARKKLPVVEEGVEDKDAWVKEEPTVSKMSPSRRTPSPVFNMSPPRILRSRKKITTLEKVIEDEGQHEADSKSLYVEPNLHDKNVSLKETFEDVPSTSRDKSGNAQREIGESVLEEMPEVTKGNESLIHSSSDKSSSVKEKTDLEEPLETMEFQTTGNVEISDIIDSTITKSSKSRRGKIKLVTPKKKSQVSKNVEQLEHSSTQLAPADVSESSFSTSLFILSQKSRKGKIKLVTPKKTSKTSKKSSTATSDVREISTATEQSGPSTRSHTTSESKMEESGSEFDTSSKTEEVSRGKSLKGQTPRKTSPSKSFADLYNKPAEGTPHGGSVSESSFYATRLRIRHGPDTELKESDAVITMDVTESTVRPNLPNTITPSNELTSLSMDLDTTLPATPAQESPKVKAKKSVLSKAAGSKKRGNTVDKTKEDEIANVDTLALIATTKMESDNLASLIKSPTTVDIESWDIASEGTVSPKSGNLKAPENLYSIRTRTRKMQISFVGKADTEMESTSAAVQDDASEIDKNDDNMPSSKFDEVGRESEESTHVIHMTKSRRSKSKSPTKAETVSDQENLKETLSPASVASERAAVDVHEKKKKNTKTPRKTDKIELTEEVLKTPVHMTRSHANRSSASVSKKNSSTVDTSFTLADVTKNDGIASTDIVKDSAVAKESNETAMDIEVPHITRLQAQKIQTPKKESELAGHTETKVSEITSTTKSSGSVRKSASRRRDLATPTQSEQVQESKDTEGSSRPSSSKKPTSTKKQNRLKVDLEKVYEENFPSKPMKVGEKDIVTASIDLSEAMQSQKSETKRQSSVRTRRMLTAEGTEESPGKESIKESIITDSGSSEAHIAKSKAKKQLAVRTTPKAEMKESSSEKEDENDSLEVSISVQEAKPTPKSKTERQSSVRSKRTSAVPQDDLKGTDKIDRKIGSRRTPRKKEALELSEDMPKLEPMEESKNESEQKTPSSEPVKDGKIAVSKRQSTRARKSSTSKVDEPPTQSQDKIKEEGKFEPTSSIQQELIDMPVLENVEADNVMATPLKSKRSVKKSPMRTTKTSEKAKSKGKKKLEPVLEDEVLDTNLKASPPKFVISPKKKITPVKMRTRRSSIQEEEATEVEDGAAEKTATPRKILRPKRTKAPEISPKGVSLDAGPVELPASTNDGEKMLVEPSDQEIEREASAEEEGQLTAIRTSSQRKGGRRERNLSEASADKSPEKITQPSPSRVPEQPSQPPLTEEPTTSDAAEFKMETDVATSPALPSQKSSDKKSSKKKQYKKKTLPELQIDYVSPLPLRKSAAGITKPKASKTRHSSVSSRRSSTASSSSTSVKWPLRTRRSSQLD